MKTQTHNAGAHPETRDYPRIVVPPPGPKGREIIKRDKRWTSTSYIKEYPLVVSHGKGAMIEDVDGNRFIDFMAGIAVASTGYSHPKVVAAVQETASRFFHICGTDFYYEEMAALCERLARLAPGQTKKRVFLTNSGTEAVDGAIKLARNATGRHALIAFKGAFHGRTYGGMSLSSSKVHQRAGFGPMIPGVHHVPFGNCYRCEYRMTYPSCQLHCVSAIKTDLFGSHLSPKDVAAIFVEPIQGEGGYIVPPMDYLKALRALCDEHGILLVFDEIQSGIGRTGKMFAAEHFGVEPDVILTAKGLGSGMPIGAIIAKESVMKWDTGSHGSTFGGNPVACAAALATLDLVENELMANARKMGERLLAGLKRLANRYAVVGDVRGLGLMIGVEFVKDRNTKEPASALVHELEQRAFRKGLLLLSCGKSVIRFAPPLVIDEYDVDTGLAILDSCLAELT
ncbi:MAG TPA: acetyl ornithine aminotransferase family protein [Elusimicrobiota bacterium]|nr:acetyl ornithine aminotransferase family protein [Elusimicrobiota bacterium]